MVNRGKVKKEKKMNDKDTIYRQAAIDAIEFGITYARAINKETGEVKELFQESNDELRKAVERVKELPSAEPMWIPCSERLPEEEVDVLVTTHFHSDKELTKNGITENYYVEVAHRIDDVWFSYADEYKINIHLHEVIAWQPLPGPWKGETE